MTPLIHLDEITRERNGDMSTFRMKQCAFVALIAISGNAAAEPPTTGDSTPEIVIRSPNFVLHTDLPKDKAEASLRRMEATLRFATRYWRRQPRGRVECFLVEDVDKWPDSALPHPLSRLWLGEIGGATIGEPQQGRRGGQNKATIYSGVGSGVVEHEVVHAYCSQAFGEMGPDWYKEGMADVAMLRAHGATDEVCCSVERIALLRNGPVLTVGKIVEARRFTYGISDSLGLMLKNRKDVHKHVPRSDWSNADTQRLTDAATPYAWSWALCHMLVHNPNYSERFRGLGNNLLASQNDSFENAFAAMHRELIFEFEFFTTRLEAGYRVDLCRWDWNKRFRSLDDQVTVRSRVAAARGFQASGLTLEQGHRYSFVSTGTWRTAADAVATSADGDDASNGQLVGIILNDFHLSKVFPLGTDGSFVASTDGQLYLRCHDDWSNLANNSGDVQVEFTR